MPNNEVAIDGPWWDAIARALRMGRVLSSDEARALIQHVEMSFAAVRGVHALRYDIARYRQALTNYVGRGVLVPYGFKRGTKEPIQWLCHACRLKYERDGRCDNPHCVSVDASNYLAFESDPRSASVLGESGRVVRESKNPPPVQPPEQAAPAPETKE